MEKNKMTKESREEVLERILEETARNPYRPANKKNERSAAQKTEKPFRKEYVQRTQVFSSAEAQEALLAEIEAQKKPRRTIPQRTAAPPRREASAVSRRPAAQQIRSAETKQEELVPSEKEDKATDQQEKINAAEKINRIKKEKAAAAKAAIMKKSELEQAIKAQEADLTNKSEKATDDPYEEIDEKLNKVTENSENNDEADTSEKNGLTLLFEAIDLFQYAACIFVAVFVIFNYIFNFTNVSGESMSPTLYEGDELLILNVGYNPQKGDVVTIDNKTSVLIDENKNIVEKSGLNCKIVKRIIAVSGDTVYIDFEKGSVVVNGQTLEEKYISEPTTRDEGAFKYPLTIPDGYVFVLGDNRNVSKDSRHVDVGLIPEGEVLGKAIFRIYPFESFGSIE